MRLNAPLAAPAAILAKAVQAPAYCASRSSPACQAPRVAPRRHADALLRNMWRWLCSPGAALSSAPLQRHVAALMRKLLAHLVGDLRRLGAQARPAARSASGRGACSQRLTDRTSAAGARRGAPAVPGHRRSPPRQLLSCTGAAWP